MADRGIWLGDWVEFRPNNVDHSVVAEGEVLGFKVKGHVRIVDSAGRERQIPPKRVRVLIPFELRRAPEHCRCAECRMLDELPEELQGWPGAYQIPLFPTKRGR